MGYPRISGNLFNCAFNCALPTLLDKIQLLAELEVQNQLPNDEDPIFCNYKELKDLFVQCYGLNPEETASFTWQQFHVFIKDYIFPAQEILFAPVFRLFIERYGREHGFDGYNPTNPDDQGTTELGVDLDTGKYLQLDFPVMEQGFYHKLGINAKVFERARGADSYVERNYAQADNAYNDGDSPLKHTEVINLYLSNGHYELQPDVSDCMEAYHNETGTLAGALEELFIATSEDMSASRTNKALAELLVEVNRKLNGALLLDAQNLQYYAENGRQFYPSGDEGTLTFAVILLVIAKEVSEDKVAERSYMLYMDALERLMNQDRGAAIVLANKVIADKCDLQLLKQNRNGALQVAMSAVAADFIKTQTEKPSTLGVGDKTKKDSNPPEGSEENEVDLKRKAVEQSNKNPSDTHINGCFNFQFNVFNALVGLGAVLLVVAIVTLPPVATAIGLSALIGAGTAGIVSASAGVSGLSLLAGLGWFACERKLEEGVELLDKTLRS
jgi:hypothetical protein